ncbi:MAG TPA: aminotransferase class I/II-fold pyridoxal phosphate-dependent enzyme [Chloroflexota bacterium]|nr:aminotransferase class I/II-fold pyridoxal phosphate-dependent enzyme [Chloroflexota bacterium]
MTRPQTPDPNPHFDTLASHAGEDDPSGAVSEPIYQTSAFFFDDIASAGRVLSDPSQGYVYGRNGLPNHATLERTIAQLEGTESAYCCGSGMGAEAIVFLALLQSGDEVLATTDLYGGTPALLSHLAGLGISTRYVDSMQIENFELSDRTKLVFVETLSNPTLRLCPLEKVARRAHDRGALLVVDNTTPTPYLCRPLEHGADLVVHSATKFLSGHHDVTGGVVAGSNELVERIRSCGVRAGGFMAPLDAWLAVRGIKTLALRMRQACDNASRLAAWLADRPRVRQVLYPGLPSHPQHALAKRLLSGGFGAMLAFEIEGDPGQLIERLKLVRFVASFGGVTTTVSHPASTSHRALSSEQRLAAGIPDGLLRLSVGIEAIDDLIADFEQALALVH